MKEPHIEGVATHDDPESCSHDREAVAEALTGARAGTALSREISVPGSRRCQPKRKATQEAPLTRGANVPARSGTRCTLGTLLHENREIPHVARR